MVIRDIFDRIRRSQSKEVPKMSRKFHRVALLALPLMVAAIAAPGALATVQFPTARQVAMHEGRSSASSTHAAVQFPTARQIAMHEGRLGASSTNAAVRFPTARQIALHEGRLGAPSPPLNEARVASNPGFNWADAGIGAGAALVLVTVVLYGAFVVNNRRRRGFRRATTA
jgi:hypothetical protein